MNSMYVAFRQSELRAEAAANRLAKEARGTTERRRLSAAVKSAWSLLSGPADRPMVLPTFNQSPFRS